MHRTTPTAWARIGALFFAIGCGGSDDTSSEAQHVVETSDGMLEFYIGQDVLNEIDETGTFVPDIADTYSLVRVPLEWAPGPGGEPVTLSLCRADNSIRATDHVFVGADRTDELQSHPEDPFRYVTDDGEEITNFSSGDAGLFGSLVLHVADTGNLLVGVAAALHVRFTDGSGYDSGLLLGAMSADGANEQEPCEPPPT